MALNILVTIPPDPDIYFDVAYLPSPFSISVPICISNNEAIDLYFKAILVNAPADWQVTSSNLGLVAAGGAACFLAEFKRLMPALTAGEYDEQLLLRIEAYTDANYTTLYGYQELTVTFHFIDHTDPSWTIVVYENYDDGLPSGWYCGGTGDPPCSYCSGGAIVSDKFLSPPHATKFTVTTLGASTKSFSVGAYTKAYVIIHVFSPSPGKFSVRINGNLVKPCNVPHPNDRWIRLVYPLTVNATNTIDIAIIDAAHWIDELIIIAK